MLPRPESVVRSWLGAHVVMVSGAAFAEGGAVIVQHGVGHVVAAWVDEAVSVVWALLGCHGVAGTLWDGVHCFTENHLAVDAAEHRNERWVEFFFRVLSGCG